MKVYLSVVCAVFLLSACSLFSRSEPEGTPTAGLLARTEKDTDTPQPGITVYPTATISTTEIIDGNTKPTIDPPREGVIFRDDFKGMLLPGWTWVDEDPQKWSLIENEQGEFLRIISDNPSIFKNGFQINSLVRDIPEGDFAITAHIISQPDENFQQANIYLFEDDANFVLMNFGFCGACFPSLGTGFFMETKVSSNPLGDTYMLPREAKDTDIYLRIVREGGAVTGYYAVEPDEWNRIAQIPDSFDFKVIGLGATNSLSLNLRPSQNLVALFDYFEVTEPPIPSP